MSFLHCPYCGVTPADTERSATSDACPACGGPARQSLFRSSLPYRRFGRSAKRGPERNAAWARAPSAREAGEPAGTASAPSHRG